MPVIYTPTEGTAIENFSRLFRRPHGCFLSIEEPDRVESSLAKFGKPEDVDYIVVSDGEEVSTTDKDKAIDQLLIRDC